MPAIKNRRNSLLKKINENANMTMEENPDNKISEILIDKIIENPRNSQIWEVRDPEVESLMRGIERRGFDDPIRVYDKKDGTYEVYSGHMRLEAMKRLGKTSIPAHVKPYPSSETEIWDDLISSNVDGRKQTIIEEAKAMVAWEKYVLRADETYSGNANQDIAEYFGTSVDKVKRLKNLLKLSPELQAKAEEGSVSYSGLSIASQLSDKDQAKLNDIIEEQQSRGETPTNQEIIDTVREIQNVKKTKRQKKSNVDKVRNSINALRKTVYTLPKNITPEEKTQIAVLLQETSELLVKMIPTIE